MIRTALVTSAFVLAFGTGIAGAQTDSAAVPVAAAPDAAAAATKNRMPAMMASFALNGAYRAIAQAEAQGAGGRYLDAAKSHYRNALMRYGSSDAGAAAEAMAAAALARAAISDRPMTVPHDIPAPPAIAAMPHRPPMQPGRSGGPDARPGMGARPGPPGGPRGGPGWMGGGRFDAATVARDAKLANSPEVTDLAQRALDADIARTRAAFAGNADEAMRDGQLAGALALAVRSLAYAAHPEAFPHPMRRASGTPRTTTDDDATPAELPPVGMLPPPDDDGDE